MLANLVCRRDGAVLRKRVAHAALVVVLAADEALQGTRVLLRDELGLLADLSALWALAHHHIGFLVRLAVRIDAQRARLGAERRHLHLGHAARGARVGQRLHLALRQRVGDVAIRPAGTADEHAARLLGHADLQILAAFGTLAHVGIGRHGIRQSVFDLLGMRQQVGKLLGEQVAAVGDHRIFGVAALGDVVHLLFKLGRHLRMRDMRGELVKGVANRHAQLAGLDGVVLDVLHRVQALDDAVARGLRAQAQLLHLLDQLALAVARRRLGLLLGALGAVEGDLLPLAHGGQLLVLLHAVRVDGTIARRHQHVALCREMLAAHFERDLRALDYGRIRQRCQESACDEVIQLVIGRCQVVRRGLGSGIDGRMVGGLLLAARGVQLAGGEQLLAIRGVRRVARDGLHHFGQVERARIHRVVDTRIGDIAVHVQAFGDAHGARRRKALRRCRGHEAGGVERHGRLLLARALLHRRHRGACRTRNGRHGRFRRRLVLEAGRGVRRREGKLAVTGGRAGSGAGVEGALDHPVVLGDERQALALARHDQRQRGRLHAAGAAHVAVAGEFDQRKVTREHRAPDQVDVLTGCTGRGKVRV